MVYVYFCVYIAMSYSHQKRLTRTDSQTHNLDQRTLAHKSTTSRFTREWFTFSIIKMIKMWMHILNLYDCTKTSISFASRQNIHSCNRSECRVKWFIGKCIINPKTCQHVISHFQWKKQKCPVTTILRCYNPQSITTELHAWNAYLRKWLCLPPQICKFLLQNSKE